MVAVTMILLVLTAAMFYNLGLITARHRHPRVPGPPEPPKPVCGCTHHLSYHSKAGKCNGYQPGVVKGDGKSLVDCRCKQYVGPQPLPELFLPELSDGS